MQGSATSSPPKGLGAGEVMIQCARPAQEHLIRLPHPSELEGRMFITTELKQSNVERKLKEHYGPKS